LRKKSFPTSSGAAPDLPASATFEPYIPANRELRELTPLPIIIGTLLGMVFGASSLYLVLEGRSHGQRVDSGGGHLDHVLPPPLEAGRKDATILENNIVQTAGSAGESIAFASA